MFKKILFRSVAGATAIGSALAFSVVASPAVVTTAPEIRNVACSLEYPSSVATSTSLTLGRSVGIYGVENSATATVSRDESGAKQPVGQVRFELSADGSIIREWTVSLRRGTATIGLPKRLGAQATYAVVAHYLPPGCSIFRSSSSNTAYYSVNKAATRSRAKVDDLVRGENPRAAVVVRSASSVAPGAKVRVVLKRNGRVLAKQVHRLSGGKATATFRKFRPGKYRVVVRYFSTANFIGSGHRNSFRITRS